MVANQMAMGDRDSEEFYAFPEMGAPQQSDEDGNDSDRQEEPEKAYVEQRAAEMNLHAELYNTIIMTRGSANVNEKSWRICNFNMCSVTWNACMMPTTC